MTLLGSKGWKSKALRIVLTINSATTKYMVPGRDRGRSIGFCAEALLHYLMNCLKIVNIFFDDHLVRQELRSFYSQ